MDWGSLRAVFRAAVAFIGAIAIAVGLAWYSLDHAPNPARTLVQRFTELLDQRDAPAAAALTSYPRAATTEIRQLYDGMSPGTVDYQVAQVIPLNQTDAYFTLDAAWHFGPHRDWAYSVRGTARRLAVGWRISWDPTVLMPGLGRGHTARLVTTYAPSPKVHDGSGALMMAEQTVNEVTIDPTRTPDRVGTAAAVAKAIAPVASSITPQSLLADLDAAHGRPVTAVSLRDDDYQVLQPDLLPIPGVVVNSVPKLITIDRRLWSPVFDSLRGTWQASREQTAGWAVRVFDAQNQPIGQLAGYQGPPGPDITSTMDPRLQFAAEDAVVSLAPQSTIVAIRPSTGAVLAVAQNDAADDAGPVAFTGLYPGGDSLNLFTPGPGPDTHTVLTGLGIGVDPKVPHLQAITGHVPNGKAESVGTGSNSIQLSPFGMAVAAATILRGTVPQSVLVQGEPGAPGRVPALKAEDLARMRTIITAPATDPASATDIHSVPGLIGYSGYADNDQWFIGARGDLVFAVHITNTTDDGSDAAARMAVRMFHVYDTPPAP